MRSNFCNENIVLLYHISGDDDFVFASYLVNTNNVMPNEESILGSRGVNSDGSNGASFNLDTESVK